MAETVPHLEVVADSFELTTFAYAGNCNYASRPYTIVENGFINWINEHAINRPQVDRVLSYQAVTGTVRLNETVLQVVSSAPEYSTRTFVQGLIFPAEPEAIECQIQAIGEGFEDNIGKDKRIASLRGNAFLFARSDSHLIRTRLDTIEVFRPGVDQEYLCWWEGR